MFLIVLTVILLIVLAAVLFVSFYAPFGGRASKDNKTDYAKRADNYADGKFQYPSEWAANGLSEDTIRSSKETSPQEDIPTYPPNLPKLSSLTN